MIEELIADLLRLVVHLPLKSWKRVRIAVSEEEYNLIREYGFEKVGYFAPAIKGVPLIVEDMPPVVLVEFRSQT